MRRNNNSKRILLVGSTSFIGKNLTRRLISSGHKVYSLDRSRINNQLPKENIFLYDISRPKTIIKAFKKIKNIDICINFAGGAGASLSSRSTFELNYFGVKYLYSACRMYGVKRFVQLSSASVYGKVSKNKVINEDSPTYPYNNYSMAKLLADDYLINNQNEETKVTILRLPQVYGRNTSVTIPGLVEKIRNSKFILFGKGSNIIHPLHVDNLVDLFIRIIDDNNAKKDGLFVLADNKYFNLKFFLETIISRFKSKKSYRTFPIFLLYILYAFSNFIYLILGRTLIKKENLLFYSSSRIIDSSKAREKLSYEPVYDCKDKLGEAIDSFI